MLLIIIPERQVGSWIVPHKLRHMILLPKAGINNKEKSGKDFLKGKAPNMESALDCSMDFPLCDTRTKDGLFLPLCW